MAECVLYRDRAGRLTRLAGLFGRYLTGSVLDVGCDVRHLARLVPGDYVGVDIAGRPDICVDLEWPLPFANGSFETVVCIDTLEHVDRLHRAFDELCRVSRDYVIVGLPNELEWFQRLGLLIGHFSGKYGLPTTRPADRHHWIFGLADVLNFVEKRGEANGFHVIREVYAYRGWRRWPALMLSVVGCLLAPCGAGLLAKAYWVVLARYESES